MSIYHGATRVAGSNKGLIKDSSTGEDTTWSSNKINQEIQATKSYAASVADSNKGLIKDSSTGKDTTWSSNKINQEIQATKSYAASVADSNKGLIKDSSTGKDTTWSSNKINQEIQATKSYAAYAAVLGNNFTNGILTERNLVNVLGATSVKNAFSKLKAKSSAGDFTNLGLGDYIDIPSITFDGQTLTHNASYENLRVQIIAFDYFKNSSNTTRHVVMQFKHCPFKKAINSGTSNAGGYPAMPIATYLSTTFGAGLEAAMGISCLSIKQHFQTAATAWSNSTGYKVFLPTENQLIGHRGSSTVAANSRSYELGQFPYYAINPKGLMKNFNGALFYYWTASPLFADSDDFALVYSNGYVTATYVNNGNIGVAPVFCI